MLRSAATEPFQIDWPGGTTSAGYLGRLRWRCSLPSGEVEAAGADEAAAFLLASIFGDVPVGREVRAKAPLSVIVGEVRTVRLVADDRMLNEWAFENMQVRGNIGDQGQLHRWLGALLAGHAHVLWARGVSPIVPSPLGAEFSFASFAADRDPTFRCSRLDSILNARLADNPCPPVVLESAAMELRALGHDLWSWDLDRVWGHDYMTKREGAGLTLSLHGWDDDDGQNAFPHIFVDFTPPKEGA